MSDVPIYYAHTDEGDDPATWQPLDDHLRGVAAIAESFSQELGLMGWGKALGLLHDIGKACPEFQARLRGEDIHVDHSTAGARYAVDFYKRAGLGMEMAYTLAGHHGGMPDGAISVDGRSSLDARLGRLPLLGRSIQDYAERLQNELPGEHDFRLPCLDAAYFAQLGDAQRRLQACSFSMYMLGRMLHSCLVDADYLDTERFADAYAAEHRGNVESLPSLLKRYEAFMAELSSSAAVAPLSRARNQILANCERASENDPGIFTLNVPTGGGKTLSSVGFALRHAIRNNMQRIIIAIPYTSIVEQTSLVLRRVFGDENVLEHHSNYDFETADDEHRLQERLAVQNWDAPIIVTTNVQFFESLFANKPGKSRKVHNIANSVVILDEAQSLPTQLLKVTLGAIEVLCESYNTSFVLCTATQPVFDDIWPFGTKSIEIATNREFFGEAFARRTYFEVIKNRLTIDQLGKRLAEHEQALCIVSSRREARDLFNCLVSCSSGEDDFGSVLDVTLPDGIFHLSTYMTPAHRVRVIAEIRRRLRAGLRCVVVSTQLIEAGVDVDFPVVYRELAGIDSLFQAAGRCNREGTSAVPKPVYVFECEDAEGKPYRTVSDLEADRELSRALINGNEYVIDDSLVAEFFKNKFSKGDESLDSEGLFTILTARNILDGFRTIPFATCAKKYRIINDAAVSVFIRWGAEAERIYQELLRCDEPAHMSRAVQQHSVGLFDATFRGFQKLQAIEEVGPFRVLQAEDGFRSFYSESTGICQPGEEEPQSLVF